MPGMLKCSQCGGRLRRVHRSFFERFRYFAIYHCKSATQRSTLRAILQYRFGPYARCPRCGTYRLSKLKERDRIDPMNTGFLNLLERMAGGRLFHCRFCRVQFYDRRSRASDSPEDQPAGGASGTKPMAAAGARRPCASPPNPTTSASVSTRCCMSACPNTAARGFRSGSATAACWWTGRSAALLTPLRARETIDVLPAPPAPLCASPEDIPLAVLYEDDDLVAIDKPAGMVVHAGAGVHSGTLVNALLHRFGALSGVGGRLRPGIVHRLDRYTSGVLLVAKNDAAHRRLAEQFSGRQVEKTLPGAGARRRQAGDSGRIERPIARDPVQRTRMTARLASGRAAWSEWKVLRRLANVHFSGGAHRHRPHAPDPRTPFQHRAPRGRRHALRRAGRTWKGSRRWAATSCTRTASGFTSHRPARRSRSYRRLPRELEEWMG